MPRATGASVPHKADEIQSPATPGRSARSRRGLLAAATGGAGVIAAQMIGKAAPAMADPNQPVLQSADNKNNTSRTAIFTVDNNEFAVLADPNKSGKGSLGVYAAGQNGGVYAQSLGTDTTNGFGTFGVAAVGGAYGVIAQGSNIAVQGESSSVTGDGVVGTGGVNGGIGVKGNSASATGAGVLAANTNGDALRVNGRATFSSSGILSIPAGRASHTKTGVNLTPASLVLATMQHNESGIWVQSAVPDVAAKSFTVHLNKQASSAIKVAWFVLN